MVDFDDNEINREFNIRKKCINIREKNTTIDDGDFTFKRDKECASEAPSSFCPENKSHERW